MAKWRYAAIAGSRTDTSLWTRHDVRDRTRIDGQICLFLIEKPFVQMHWWRYGPEPVLSGREGCAVLSVATDDQKNRIK
ncbi:MAG TPA: hypothetical protein DEF21_13835 [Thalassospira lucentensis]|uniref:Uncharacterized protein n=1 Tax=Thalassospira lucentensis TaxID=168935 RepID=A0A358HUW0_9PROT|nr:hypothetical protein [Thalassospira lucentensis]HCW69578.1 hypothetical protein [Thalassospira lucentensis]